jgi:predicted RNase H-like HicB family nuclease
MAAVLGGRAKRRYHKRRNSVSKVKGQRNTTQARAGRSARGSRPGRASAKHIFQVLVEQDEAGYFVAECPALRACYTQGKTYEAVIENIKDVIALCLAEMKARGERIPP